MTWLLFLLLLLYVGLTLLYVFTPPTPPSIPPWPLLPTLPDVLEAVGSCQTDSECPLHHVCLNGTCVRRLMSDSTCHPERGQWIPYTYQNAPFAICSCHNHTLYTQKFFGGDCNVSMACGVHGTYQPATHTCLCEPGYKAVDLECRKVPILLSRTTPCGPDEIDVLDATREGFHADYVARLGNTRCVKRPCSFDSLSGRPLKHGRFEPGWGCVCDPTFGLFGVVLQVPRKQYLTTEGYDACASIFEQEPLTPMYVELVTHFYLAKRAPVSMILFKGLEEDHLHPLLRGRNGSFALHQSLWRYDFAQYLFHQKTPMRARTRRSDYLAPFGFHRVRGHVLIHQFQPVECPEVRTPPQQAVSAQALAYQQLYHNPVCTIPERLGASVEAIFHNRVVLNPEMLNFKTTESYPRFNAMVINNDIRLGKNEWTLDLDYEYRIDTFLNMPTNVPFGIP